MFQIPQGRTVRVTVWSAALALATVSVAVGGAGSAGAVTHASTKGTVQLCVHSSQSKATKIVLSKSGWSKTLRLTTKAHVTVCSTKMTVVKGTYLARQTAAHGTRVSAVTVAPSSYKGTHSVAASWAKAAVKASHATRFTFTNSTIAVAPTPPPAPTPAPPPVTPPATGNGYIEVCKAAADGYVVGNVTVRVTAGSFSASQIVPVGQCTGPMQVPAGNATVSETAPAPYGLSGVLTNPTSALVSTNLAANSTVVKVAASADGSNETLVTLVNSTRLAQFKVCKTLTANSGDLITNNTNGFVFDVSYTALGQSPYSTKVNVVVPSLNQAACVLYPIALPLGTIVNVTEEAAANTTLTAMSVFPASQDMGSAGRTAAFALGPNASGITTASFTNQADGTLEICKNIDDNSWSRGWNADLDGGPADGQSPYNGYPFQFSVNGGSAITVKAGYCSAPLSVPAGTATVQELAAPNFNLESFTATGPDGSTRILSGANPITVSVPAGGVGNETLVTATNRVNTGQVKVCKILSANVPVGKSYRFYTTFHLGRYNFGQWTTLQPTDVGAAGEVCSYLSSPLPVIDPSGHVTAFTTTEGASPFGLTASGQLIVEPTAITYDGNGTMTGSKVWQAGDPGRADGTYFGCAQIGQGVNVITFQNSLVLDP